MNPENLNGFALPPSSVEAEQNVIGALLTDASGIERVGGLMPSDFYASAHRAIYQAIQDCDEAGDPIETVTVFERLTRNGQIDAAGGMDYLREIYRNCAGANVGAYARMVREKALERELLATLNDLTGQTLQRDLTAREKLDLAQAKIMSLSERESSEPLSMASHVPAFREVLNKRATRTTGGVTTGFVDLDRSLRDLEPGDLIVIAGRPSMGKSALAFQIGENSAFEGRSTLLLSMEMSVQKVMDRVVAGMTRLPMEKILSGEASGYSSVEAALARLGSARLYIDDAPALTVMDIRAKARAVKRRHGLDLIVVDYLQLMSGEGDNRNAVIEAITRSLKSLAKELNIPVIAISQLSRKCDDRTDKRPLISDLRDSGAIEQDADIIIFVYREEQYRPNDDEWRGKAEALIRKNRQGPCGDVHLTFLGYLARFENLAGAWPERSGKGARRVVGGFS